jgi:hypothetical protein
MTVKVLRVSTGREMCVRLSRPPTERRGRVSALLLCFREVLCRSAARRRTVTISSVAAIVSCNAK